jgi:uncharacterized damage-inducible protein DinB
MNHLTRLAAHLAWADAEVLSGLRAAKNDEPACLELFAHILGAEAVWLSRIKGEKATVAVWPRISLMECVALAEANARDLAELVSRLEPEDLPRAITYLNSEGKQFTSTLEDILLHVCLHGSYHRGQVARALRLAGDQPVATDFIAFIRGAPTAKKQA